MSTLDPMPASSDDLHMEVLLRLADDRLILGQRVSEWCGHGPELEEDLALANIALDLIGTASAFYTRAARLRERMEGLEEGALEDDHLAYFRDDIDFRNLQMCELPIGDFAFTIARQFLFSVHSMLLMEFMADAGPRGVADAGPQGGNDGNVNDGILAGICGKHLKEVRYHVRHSREWMIRLGDGTQESHRRMQSAVDDLWMYTGELFAMDAVGQAACDAGLWPDMAAIRARWDAFIAETLAEAGLRRPEEGYMADGGRTGFHTEHLGPLLAQMQFLRRSHPEASWT
jgi:ring-1,2-phenylacetyl-CoA epoxidase subunit PaaC